MSRPTWDELKQSADGRLTPRRPGGRPGEVDALRRYNNMRASAEAKEERSEELYRESVELSGEAEALRKQMAEMAAEWGWTMDDWGRPGL